MNRKCLTFCRLNIFATLWSKICGFCMTQIFICNVLIRLFLFSVINNEFIPFKSNMWFMIFCFMKNFYLSGNSSPEVNSICDLWIAKWNFDFVFYEMNLVEKLIQHENEIFFDTTDSTVLSKNISFFPSLYCTFLRRILSRKSCKTWK